MPLPSKRTAFLIAAVLCGFAIAFLVRLRTGEPRADGRTLTFWVNEYAERRPDPEASAALSSIGAPAIPHLLKWLEYERPMGSGPPVNRKRWKWIEKTFGINVDELFRDEDLRRANNSAVAFCALGSNASLAVPRLRHLLQGPNAIIGFRAARALSEIPGDGVQELVVQITNPDPRVRVRCAGNLRFAGTNDSRVVPALIRALKDDDYMVSVFASRALRSLKTDPQILVPLLTENLQHANPGQRLVAAFELTQFGTNARSAVPALLGALNDKETSVQEKARIALKAIAPEALTNALPR